MPDIGGGKEFWDIKKENITHVSSMMISHMFCNNRHTQCETQNNFTLKLKFTNITMLTVWDGNSTNQQII